MFRNDGELFVRAEARAEVYPRSTMYVRLSTRYTLARYISGVGRRRKRSGLTRSTIKRPSEPFGYNAMHELSRIWDKNAHLQVPGVP